MNMYIYAIRDRLLDYFQTPFVAPGDNEVKASVSQAIMGENQSAIAQTPHHFEVWKIAEVDDEGYINPIRELVCDVSALIRTERQPPGPTGHPLTRPPGQSTDRPVGGNGDPTPYHTSVSGAAITAADAAQAIRGGHPGSN